MRGPLSSSIAPGQLELCPGNPWEIVGNRLENQPSEEEKNGEFINKLPHPSMTQSCFWGHHRFKPVRSQGVALSSQAQELVPQVCDSHQCDCLP